jgi:uncharacterized protein (DUF302 family)
MTNPTYGLTRDLPRVSFHDAKDRAVEALRTEGFGVLAEIDIQAALQEKLGVDIPGYTILGACNPPLAHRAIQAEPFIGLLLPCNVVVMSRGSEGSTVSIADPKAMFRIVGNPALDPVVEEVETKLRRVLDRV